MNNKREVQASVKDERLVKVRRDQMIRGAVSLFKEKGYHKTTTREIANQAGFSIGTLYEYIRTKEDVLYLVCDSIYSQVSERLEKMNAEIGDLASLKQEIAYFFKIMDEMQDEVLVMYQEAKSLSKEALPYVLKKELEMVAMFERLINSCIEKGELEMTPAQVHLLANNIFVQGQMWGFRRWTLHKTYTLEEYIQLQIELLFTGIEGFEKIEQIGERR